MAPSLTLLLAACFGALASAATLGQGLAAAGQARLTQLEAEWSHELDGPKKVSPVKRVVAVLQKMKAELEEETTTEAEMYDKLVCWCETNEKEKTRAVAEADSKDAQLVSEIEGRSARFGELSAEIVHLKEQIEEDNAVLKEAVALKESSSSDSYAEQKDLVQAINNLENAIAVLSKHHTGSFLQLDKPLMAGLRVMLRDTALKYQLLVAAKGPRQGQHGTAFLAIRSGSGEQAKGASGALMSALDIHGADVPDALPLKFAEQMVERSARQAAGAFLQQNKQPFASYSSQSDGIWGILNQMMDEFKASLARSQAEAKKAAQEGAALIQAKEAQIEAGKKKLDELQAEHAGNQKALADAKEDLEATRKQRAADVEFLGNLKLSCGDIDSQWKQRSETRGAELQAVSETISILTEDEAHDLLGRSVSLLQLQASSHEASGVEAKAQAALRARVVKALRLAAQAPAFEADDLLAAWRGRRGAGAAALGAAAGPRAQLSTLAMTVQLDSFSEVKKAIDQLVGELQAQQKEEVDFKAYCQEQFTENENALYAKNEQKKDIESKIDQLNALVDTLQKEIEAANTQIAETQVNIKKASETREKENAEYQTIVADQRATQELLKKALVRLQDFYVKGLGKQVFAQKAAQTPPVQFNSYKNNQGASPVMGLLEQIIGDSDKLESEAIAGEAASQKSYESFVKDSNTVIAQLTEAVVTKTKGISAAQVEKANAESDLEGTSQEIQGLSDYEADLHSQCDWLLKNFDIRQEARLHETEAIQAAKAILSGAKGF